MSSRAPEPIIDPLATIGAGTTIAEGCVIGKHVTIGEGNTIAPYVVIDGHTTIGDHNTIASHTVLGTPPQDIKSSSETVGLRIGDHNQIGAYSLISAGTDHGGGLTVVGDHNRLMARIHIGHDVQMGDHCYMAEDAALGGHTVVEDHVHFGVTAAVHQFVHIGSYADVTDEAALTQDVPPYCRVSGNRAKLSGLNQQAIERLFDTKERHALEDAYRELFEEDGSPKASAQKALEASHPASSSALYQFVANSKRGVPFRRRSDVH